MHIYACSSKGSSGLVCITAGLLCSLTDDVALHAELLELLVPALETMVSEAASLGLELNWQKTKVQALGSREDVPSTITVLDQEVAVVEKFVYLGSLVHSSTQSSPDISRRDAITRAAMKNLDKQIWRSRITIQPS